MFLPYSRVIAVVSSANVSSADISSAIVGLVVTISFTVVL